MNRYNTQKPRLILKEYGRNIQKIVDYVKTIEDREKRTKSAETLIELMKQVNPSMNNDIEYTQKLWDDVFIMADYDLDVDSPFPLPEKELLGKKPGKVPYKDSEVRFRHYGRNVELLITQVEAMTDPEEQEEAVYYIFKLMNTFYNAYNRDLHNNEKVIIGHMKAMMKRHDLIDEEKIMTRFQKDQSRTDRRPKGHSNPSSNNRGRNNKGGKSSSNSGKRKRN
ncbi:MAG: DUF4290 domain-containing protein [Cyclobacteriaceae bacterium]|nr:DUF4290 domain-containing protein [Cyclobacteriaceae bacterium]MCH8516974.1 DUF4290 domain-containing protein [Cyclobacteriaceae bacterium]